MKYFHINQDDARSSSEMQAQHKLFEMARLKVNHEGLLPRDDWKLYIARLATYCCDMGVPEDCAIYEVTRNYWKRKDEAVLCIHNHYAEHKQTFGKCRTMNKEQRTQFWLEEFLRRNYKLRYNQMTREAEYIDLTDTQFDFRPITDRILYDMEERANREGIAVWENTLKRRLLSSSRTNYEPMYDFLVNLPKWDKKPRIKRLADTIPTDTPNWQERFYRWFLSMVAHWLRHDPKFPNEIIPVLVGKQGCGKSQWIRALLPEELQSYYHDGFDIASKNAERMMTRYALINIDEFDAIPPRLEPTLKHILQLGTVHIDNQPAHRYCSFIATSNHYGLHRDTSGSRRYVFVDIKDKIRLNHRLNMLQVYAEAKYAVEHNERTYLSEAQETAMQRDNESFREQDISEQMFLHFYEPLTTRSNVNGSEWLSAYEIYERLEKLTKKDLGKKRANKFGAILRKYCAPGGVKRGKTSTLYHVKIKDRQ